MASTKIITPTNLRIFLAGAGVLLAVWGVINLGDNFMPAAKANLEIEKNIVRSSAATENRTEILAAMRDRQEELLAQKPAEPYAWSRLAYLRSLQPEQRKAALAALKMADMVSPNGRRQIVERAARWHELKDVHSEEDAATETCLWQKAFALNQEALVAYVRANKMQDVVGAAVMQDPVLAEKWKRIFK